MGALLASVVGVGAYHFAPTSPPPPKPTSVATEGEQSLLALSARLYAIEAKIDGQTALLRKTERSGRINTYLIGHWKDVQVAPDASVRKAEYENHESKADLK